MEIGVYTFADSARDPKTGHLVTAQQRLRDVIEEVELADEVGLDVFGVGERRRRSHARTSRPSATNTSA